MNSVKFKKFVKKVEQFLDSPDELRKLANEAKKDLNKLEDASKSKEGNGKKEERDTVHPAVKFIKSSIIGASESTILLFELFLVISVPAHYIFSLLNKKYQVGEIIVNNYNVFKMGIQALIGLLAVIAVAGLSYLSLCYGKSEKMSDEERKKRNETRTGIIKLLRIIIVFVLIFSFLGFFKHIGPLAVIAVIAVIVAIVAIRVKSILSLRFHQKKDAQKPTEEEKFLSSLITLGLINLSLFLNILFWLGYFEHISINLFIFISLSSLFYMTARYLGELFERHEPEKH